MSLIRRNIFWLLVSQAATWVATLVALIFVPNSLGSADLGAFGYATGFVMFFTLFGGLGTSAYLSREIARDYGLLGRYVFNAVLLKWVLWIVLSIVAMALAYALGNRGQTLLLIAISCAGMLPFLLQEVYSGALGGMQRLARPAMWTVAQVYFQTVFGILVLLLGWGVVAYTIVMTSGVLIPTIATWLMCRPMLHGHRVLDFGVWRLLIVGGIPLLLLNFLNLIYGTVDVPILHRLAGDDPVGWYVVAQRWVSIPVFITTAVVGAYYPAFSQHGKPITDEFAPLVNRALNIILIVNLPAAMGLAFIADDLMRFMYDTEFDQSIVVIKILAVGIPIMALDTVLAIALVASERINRYLYVGAVAAVLNPIGCVLLINFAEDRYDNGAIGAAIVTVVTELWVMSWAMQMRSPGILDRAEMGRVMRIVAATVAMVPGLWITSGAPLVVQVIVGVGSFGIASLAFRVFSIAELRETMSEMRRTRRRTEAEEGPEEGSVEDGTGVGPPHPRVGGDLYPQP
jgi:O-antigen/teichoic acid export membrane protein